MILSFLPMFRLSYKLKSQSEMLPLDLGKVAVSGIYGRKTQSFTLPFKMMVWDPPQIKLSEMHMEIVQ